MCIKAGCPAPSAERDAGDRGLTGGAGPSELRSTVMKVLLVHAKFPLTYWGFQHAMPFVGARATLPPLGLITLAALLPRAWSLRLVDLNVEPLTEDDLLWADAVLVGGMLIQRASMLDVVERARRIGKRTVVGGPGPTTSSDAFEAADRVFVGEAEGREESLIRAIAGSGPRVLAREGERPDLDGSPTPRFDLLARGAYASMSVQTSRGCPYRCEFCDVVAVFGNAPRVKSPQRVLAELDALQDWGHRGSVFVVDDNFVGNRTAARALLPRLAAWQAAHGRPFELYTEASLNLAQDEALTRACVDAGFTSVFVGIETPSLDALRAANKLHNASLDLRSSVLALTGAGLEVMGGFIVGFDADGPDAFDRQIEFIGSLPIPLAMVGLLQALPGTPLWSRLEREGRLRGPPTGDQFGAPNFETRMGDEALLAGYARLLRALYSPSAYAARAEALIRASPASSSTGRVLERRDVATALRTLVRVGLGPRRGLLHQPLWRAAGRGPHAIARAFTHAIMGEHMVRYTEEEVLPRVEAALTGVRRTSGTTATPTALATS